MAETLTTGNMLPPINLPETSGRKMNTWDFKGRQNLLLYFFDPNANGCLHNLKALAEIHASIRDLDTQMAAIGKGSPEFISARLGKSEFPFPVLSDANGAARMRLGAGVSTLIIADRFGEIRERWDMDCDIPLDVRRILDVLGLIELECPECGAPTWQP